MVGLSLTVLECFQQRFSKARVLDFLKCERPVFHKNMEANIHKSGQPSAIMECNHNDTSALVTIMLQMLVRQRITNVSNVNNN